MAPLLEFPCECGKMLRVPRWRSEQKGRCGYCRRQVAVPSFAPTAGEVEFQDADPSASPMPGNQPLPLKSPTGGKHRLVKLVVILSVVIVPVGAVVFAYLKYPFLWQRISSQFASEKGTPQPDKIAVTNKPPENTTTPVTTPKPTPEPPTVDTTQILIENIPGDWYPPLIKQFSLVETILVKSGAGAGAGDAELKKKLKEFKFYLDRIKNRQPELERLALQLEKQKFQKQELQKWFTKTQNKTDGTKKEELKTFQTFILQSGNVDLEMPVSLAVELATLEKEAKVGVPKKATIAEILRKVRMIEKKYGDKTQQIMAWGKEFLLEMSQE